VIVPRLVTIVLLMFIALPAYGQTKPAPPPPQPGAPQTPATPQPAPPARPASQTTSAQQNPSPIRVRGLVTFGAATFQAQESFEAILESRGGLMYGGGGQVLLPLDFYAEVGVWRFSSNGERAFVGPDQEIFPLGIPVDVSVTPIEITGGWRYRHCPQPPRAPGTPRTLPPARTTPSTRPCAPRVIPYVGGGLSIYKYTETSEFADASEDVDERFSGYHLLGGAEVRLHRWVSVGGEVGWSSVPDALDGGVAAAFDEHNLGGATFRIKFTVGR
jgi:hypothetical protein